MNSRIFTWHCFSHFYLDTIFGWHWQNLHKNSIRTCLKLEFFKYPTKLTSVRIFLIRITKTIIMVEFSLQGARHGTGAKSKKVKIIKTLRKRCDRAAMTYIDAIRPKGNGKYKNGHRQIKNSVQNYVDKTAPRIIQQSH